MSKLQKYKTDMKGAFVYAEHLINYVRNIYFLFHDLGRRSFQCHYMIFFSISYIFRKFVLTSVTCLIQIFQVTPATCNNAFTQRLYTFKRAKYDRTNLQ